MTLKYTMNKNVFFFSPMSIFWNVNSTRGPGYSVSDSSFTSILELPRTFSSVVFEMTWEPALQSRGYAALGMVFPALRHIMFNLRNSSK